VVALQRPGQQRQQAEAEDEGGHRRASALKKT
jgi:hypothetical protein